MGEAVRLVGLMESGSSEEGKVDFSRGRVSVALKKWAIAEGKS